MTATATKPMPTAAAEDSLSKLAEVDAKMCSLKSRDVKLHPDHLEQLRGTGVDVDDRDELFKEISRGVTVGRLKDEAGTAAEYQRAQRSVRTKESNLAKAQPGLEEVIAQGEKAAHELAALEGEVQTAKSVVEDMDAKRSQLRQPRLLPVMIRRRYNHADQHAEHGTGVVAAINECEARLNAIALVNEFPADSSEALQWAKFNAPQLVSVESRGDRWRVELVNVTEWSALGKQMAAERPSVEKRLGDLRAELVRRKAEADTLLNYYTSQL